MHLCENRIIRAFGANDKVRIIDYLRDATYSEALSTFLRKFTKLDKNRDRDVEVSVGRLATCVVTSTLHRSGEASNAVLLAIATYLFLAGL